MTALYEVEAPSPGALGTLALRWKEPAAEASLERTIGLHDGGAGWTNASNDLRFAAAVATFGMRLRGSSHAGEADLSWARAEAAATEHDDPRRAELVELIDLAIALAAELPAVGSK